jgi:alpha-L-fucosidase
MPSSASRCTGECTPCQPIQCRADSAQSFGRAVVFSFAVRLLTERCSLLRSRYSSNALGEWYGNYIGENASDRTPAHNQIQTFHDKVYGSAFEYSQFVGEFMAELYEPSDWAKLFKRAGAKWAILTSKHHDGFELWPSPQATSNFPQFGAGWNSAKLGPKRDLLGDLMTSLREEGLRAGFYHSLFEWYNPLYRGADPKSYVTEKLAPDLRDLVTRYLPDDILVDGEWEQDSDFWETKQFLQWLFNDSPVKDTVAVNDRWGKETRGAHGGYFVCENGAYSTFCNGSYGGPAHPVSDHPWIYWATTCPQVRSCLSRCRLPVHKVVSCI